MRKQTISALAGAAVIALGAVAAAPLAMAEAPQAAESSSGDRYVLRGRGGSLPAGLASAVAARGAVLEQAFPQIGVAIVRADESFAAANLRGIEAIVPDQAFELAQPPRFVEFEAAEKVDSIADGEPFYFLQWAPGAVQAPEAWNAGYTGAGVRVAVLDGGLYAAHADLAANVDVAASRSFVPGFDFNQDTGTFWHGTHVAGIVGAPANGVGVVGIAPSSTLIGVKVLHAGSGAFSQVIEGIMYAAMPVAQGGAGAQVINMSLGAVIPSGHGNEDPGLKAAVRELVKAIDDATTYAWNQGVTVIAAAGNAAINFDEEKDVLSIPSSNARVISVAATGPFGWAYGDTSFARQASYTNSGKSAVSMAAPGGDFAWPTNEACTVINSAGTIGVSLPCWAFDMYLSTSRGNTPAGAYSWAAGTSMASPVVAGVAALIIEKAGGRISPALVEQRLMQGAQDLGKPGNDEVYGRGWVNAYESVQR